MKQKVCLLIDDDIDDQDFFSMAINEIDSSIICRFANNGLEGLRLLQDADVLPPNYIFIDLNMPRMGGKECLINIRKTPKLNQIPTIIYSTSSEQRVQNEMIELGATKYMVKPLQLSELIRNLSEFFKKFDAKY